MICCEICPLHRIVEKRVKMASVTVTLLFLFLEQILIKMAEMWTYISTKISYKPITFPVKLSSFLNRVRFAGGGKSVNTMHLGEWVIDDKLLRSRGHVRAWVGTCCLYPIKKRTRIHMFRESLCCSKLSGGTGLIFMQYSKSSL